MKAFMILKNGFEEIEAITVIDVLRRAEIDTVTVCAEDQTQIVSGSHDISVTADTMLENLSYEKDFQYADILVLPGGPGTGRMKEDKKVLDLVKRFYEDGKVTAAICAAPTVFEKCGITEGKTVTCFPGVKDEIFKGHYLDTKPTVTDGNMITSRGAGTALHFALTIVSKVSGDQKAISLAQRMIYDFS